MYQLTLSHPDRPPSESIAVITAPHFLEFGRFIQALTGVVDISPILTAGDRVAAWKDEVYDFDLGRYRGTITYTPLKRPLDLRAMCLEYNGSRDFDSIEMWVDQNIDDDEALALVTEHEDIAECLHQWIRDDGFGDWSALVKENSYTPFDTMRMAVASWLHSARS